MTNENNETTGVESIDVEDLLDSTLDDLEDLPENKAYPVGSHHVILSLALKKINDRSVVELEVVAIETIELASSTDEPLNEGDTTANVFFLDSEFGRGALKKTTMPLKEALGTTTIRELIEACQQIECQIVTTLREDKKEKGKYYTNIKELIVV